MISFLLGLDSSIYFCYFDLFINRILTVDRRPVPLLDFQIDPAVEEKFNATMVGPSLQTLGTPVWRHLALTNELFSCFI